jgi:hypothetical protein
MGSHTQQRSQARGNLEALAYVQGALYGVRALASGLGLVIFSRIFHAFTQKQRYLPWVPMLCLAGLLLIGVVLALALHVPVQQRWSASDGDDGVELTTGKAESHDSEDRSALLGLSSTAPERARDKEALLGPSSVGLRYSRDAEALLGPNSTIYEDADGKDAVLGTSMSALEGLPSPSRQAERSHAKPDEGKVEAASTSSIGSQWHALVSDGTRVDEKGEGLQEQRSRWHSSVTTSGLSHRGHSIDLQRSLSGQR